MSYYTGLMPRPLSRPRPPAGQRLLQLRKAAGLSQVQLAQLVGETQRNIAYWEASDHPPRSDILPALSRVLGVRLEDLLNPEAPLARKPGPVSKLHRLLDELAELPKRQQDRVLEMLELAIQQQRQEKIRPRAA